MQRKVPLRRRTMFRTLNSVSMNGHQMDARFFFTAMFKRKQQKRAAHEDIALIYRDKLLFGAVHYLYAFGFATDARTFCEQIH